MDKNKIIGLIVIVGLAYLVYTMMSADDPMNEHNDNETACLEANGAWAACEGDDCADGAGTCSTPAEAAEGDGDAPEGDDGTAG